MKIIIITKVVYRASKTTDPVQRFVEVCRFFLSGWHIKPKVTIFIKKKDLILSDTFHII